MAGPQGPPAGLDHGAQRLTGAAQLAERRRAGHGQILVELGIEAHLAGEDEPAAVQAPQQSDGRAEVVPFAQALGREWNGAGDIAAQHHAAGGIAVEDRRRQSDPGHGPRIRRLAGAIDVLLRAFARQAENICLPRCDIPALDKEAAIGETRQAGDAPRAGRSCQDGYPPQGVTDLRVLPRR